MGGILMVHTIEMWRQQLSLPYPYILNVLQHSHSFHEAFDWTCLCFQGNNWAQGMMLLCSSLSTEDEEGPWQRSHLSVDMVAIKWPGHHLEKSIISGPRTYTPDSLLMPTSNAGPVSNLNGNSHHKLYWVFHGVNGNHLSSLCRVWGVLHLQCVLSMYSTQGLITRKWENLFI